VPTGPERERAWVEQYEAAYPEVFEVYYRGYGDPEGRSESAARVERLAGDLADREQRLRLMLHRAEAAFVAAGLLSAGDELPVVLMVGTAGSDAWVDVFRGVPTLFVALEMVSGPTTDELLLTHELVHVAHYRRQVLALASDPHLREQVGFRVWAEGLAVTGTRMLMPGRAETAYFSVDSDEWFDNCRARLPLLARTIRDHLSDVDAALVHTLCGVSTGQPWPSRAGYWVGDLIARELVGSGFDLNSLLDLRPGDVADVLLRSTTLAADCSL